MTAGIIDDIKTAMYTFQDLHISFSPITCYTVAHRLESLAFDDAYRSVWIGSPRLSSGLIEPP